MHLAAIVLAGGRSTRMGQPKASLDRDGVSFLEHVVAVASAAVAPGAVVVAAAPGQALPALPADVEVVHDAVTERGPLEGMRVGLEALSGRVDAALVLATDLPLLRPELGPALAGLLGVGFEAVVPLAHGHRHPLAALYRVSVLETVERVLASGPGKPGLLLAQCSVRFVDARELLADPALAAADPALDSLVNVNTPEELEQARAWWRAAGERT